MNLDWLKSKKNCKEFNSDDKDDDKVFIQLNHILWSHSFSSI